MTTNKDQKGKNKAQRFRSQRRLTLQFRARGKERTTNAKHDSKLKRNSDAAFKLQVGKAASFSARKENQSKEISAS